MLVGRFQYHFARVEQKIDQAVIKLSVILSRVPDILQALPADPRKEISVSVI